MSRQSPFEVRLSNQDRAALEECAGARSESHARVVRARIDRLAELMNPGPGEWRVVQFYRFVEGRRRTGFGTWDCTGPDWRNHWTSLSETYCLNDFLRAVDTIAEDVVLTDPASVAEAWGRRPGR